MKKRKQQHKIEIPLYFAYLHILRVKSFKGLIKKHNLEDKFKDSEVLSIRALKKGHYILAFKNKTVTPGEVAHEALHITNMVFEDRHVKSDLDNDEPQCYLLEWVVNQVHKKIKVSS